jgi:SAM-dependent methyltransferase
MKLGSIHRLFPQLLPKTALVKTSDVDAGEWTFHPFLGIIQRLRFWLILSLLPTRRFTKLLEVGYGSGIFLPELSQYCKELYGVDIHQNASRVSGHLRRQGVEAKLLSGSATVLPFKDKTFDLIIAVSCLEYMDPLESAVQEIKRVLRPDGCFIFVTPGNSPVIDCIHDLLTGRKVREHYAERRDVLIPLFTQSFVVQQELAIPPFSGRLMTLYRGFRLGVS